MDAPKTPAKPRTAQQRLWIVMGVRVRFTIGNLVEAANARHEQLGEREVRYETARSYVYALRDAGYLRRTNPQRDGQSVAAIYVLARHTGPIAPSVREHGGIFDPNTKRIVGAPHA